MAARTGRRSLTSRTFPRSAPLRWRHPITTPFTSAPVKQPFAAIPPTAPAFTSRSMLERTGKISVCATPARSARSSCIRIIPTSCWWPHLVTHSVQMRNAEFSGPATAGKRGRKFSRKMRTLARSMSCSIRIILMSSSLRSGRHGGSRGFFPVAARAAVSINRKITA